MGMYGCQWNWVTSVFDDMTAGSTRMNSDMYVVQLTAQIQPNAAKLRMAFTVQMGKDTKDTTQSTQELLKTKKFNILQWSRPDLNPTELLFTQDKTEGRDSQTNKLHKAAVKAWQSISREDTQR